MFHHSSDHRLYPLVVARHVLPPLLHTSDFSASDDAVADSYDTQSGRFGRHSTHMAIKLLATKGEARKHTIAEAVWREINWVMPRDRGVSNKVNGGKIAVECGPQTPAPEGCRGGRTARRTPLACKSGRSSCPAHMDQH